MQHSSKTALICVRFDLKPHYGLLAKVFVQLCTAGLLQEGHTLGMTAERTKYDDIVVELERQGLTVRLHSRENNTWHIADGGLYSGYVAGGDELVELNARTI
jgi:hypothetical protein